MAYLLPDSLNDCKPRWQLQEWPKIGEAGVPTWKDFTDVENLNDKFHDQVRMAQQTGHNVVSYQWADAEMEIDIDKMTQTNKQTGTVRRIRLVYVPTME